MSFLQRSVLVALSALLVVGCQAGGGRDAEESATAGNGREIEAPYLQPAPRVDPFVAHAIPVRDADHPDSGSYLDGGNTSAAAHAAAQADCENKGRSRTCTVTSIYDTRDAGTSNLNGPSICAWEAPNSGMRGYTEGKTRANARDEALKDCQLGGEHPAGGLECRVYYCFAKGNPYPPVRD